MKKSFIYCIVLLLALAGGAHAQVMEKQATYAITGKSKRGSLANVEYNASAKTYTLTYSVSITGKKIKFEIYTFDADFKFLKFEEDEIEFEKARTKYTWFKFKKMEYSVEGTSVEPNMMGTLVLRRKRITYKFDPWIFGYTKKVEVLEKLKPKSDEGNKYFYYNHAEDDVSGDIFVLVGVKPKKASSGDASPNKNFKVLKFNRDLDLLSESKVDFDYPQSLAIVRGMYTADDENPDEEKVNGMVVVFTPLGGPGMKKIANPDKNAYTYVHFDANGAVKSKVPFTSPATYWRINELVTIGDKHYFFGPSAEGKDKYWNELVATEKFKAVQLMLVKNGKLEYITSTNLEEFDAKIQTPPTQKKSPSYDGKKFRVAHYDEALGNEFMVFGQNIRTVKDGIQMKDIITFHFDSKGILKSQYSVDVLESTDESKAYGTPQQMFTGEGEGMGYWLLRELDGMSWTDKLLSYPRMAKVDLKAGKFVNDFVRFGKTDSGTYFLDPKFPYLQTSEANTLVFFGSDKKGKNLWFGKVLLK